MFFNADSTKLFVASSVDSLGNIIHEEVSIVKSLVNGDLYKKVLLSNGQNEEWIFEQHIDSGPLLLSSTSSKLEFRVIKETKWLAAQ